MPKTASKIPARQRISLQAAAEYAGVHVNTLRRHIASGDLPAYRFGARLLRVDMADVEALFVAVPNAESQVR
jgi:excisionase family DNA binding protein